MATVVKMRICRECGNAFNGGPRAWYCPECRRRRKVYQSREYKERKRKGYVQPLGTVIKCIDCGKEFAKKGGMHKRCPECAAMHLHEVDAEQSSEWKKNNIKAYKEAKKQYEKKKYEQGENKKSGIPGITWDREKCQWRIHPYDAKKKKQIHVGYEKELENAKQRLEKWNIKK